MSGRARPCCSAIDHGGHRFEGKAALPACFTAVVTESRRHTNGCRPTQLDCAQRAEPMEQYVIPEADRSNAQKTH